MGYEIQIGNNKNKNTNTMNQLNHLIESYYLIVPTSDTGHLKYY